ncbi:MAG: potassium transporter Trk [Deltaproteobacteria bacterium]|nr:potassium transporter Trk [Deltaproteobacteria bacterium]
MSFVLLILFGALVLMAAPGMERGPALSTIDALFTAASAVTVTGLTVVDTAEQFTWLGQLWLLVCIQLGGIGLITLTTMLIGALGKRLSLRSEMLGMLPVRRHDRPEVWEVAIGVAKFSLAIELVGAIVLFLLWLPHFSVGEAAWHALFHSISAYCNAGFTSIPGGFARFQDAPLTLIATSILVVLGGLGYLTFEELIRWWRSSKATRDGGRIRFQGSRRLSSHTYAVVVTSAVLLVGGWILFALFEWADTLAHMSVIDKITNAWFMSVMPRSGGFNTVDYAHIGNASATLTMLLMFVGGSPGSMAGGIKTTTLAVIVALGMSRFRGKRFVEIKDRAIPQGTIERTIGVVLLFIAVLIVSFFLLGWIQGAGLNSLETRLLFLPIAFETLSAFTTTGLSMGSTADLAYPSKLLLIVLMFIGRVGLFSFFAAVILRRSQPPAFVRLAQEDVIVG